MNFKVCFSCLAKLFKHRKIPSSRHTILLALLCTNAVSNCVRFEAPQFHVHPQGGSPSTRNSARSLLEYCHYIFSLRSYLQRSPKPDGQALLIKTAAVLIFLRFWEGCTFANPTRSRQTLFGWPVFGVRFAIPKLNGKK